MNNTTDLSVGTAALVSSDFTNGLLNNTTFANLNVLLHTVFETSECDVLVSFNHILFQFANIFILLSYFATTSNCGAIFFRIVLTIGCAFYAAWSIKVFCSIDALIWNIVFILCNLIHILIVFARIWPSKFTKELEELYINVFKPLKVSRKQFKKLLKCIKSVESLKYQDSYAQEKVTRVEYLSLVLSGKLVISQQSRALHIVFPHQFLDSPEWFGVSTDDFFQVSITAMEDSKILIWHRDKLKLSIIRDRFLQTILDHILSRDVVNKLIQVNDAVSASMNGLLANNFDDELDDNKSHMVVKKSGDSNGITALLNRQLQSDKSKEMLPLLCRPPYFQLNEQISKVVFHSE